MLSSSIAGMDRHLGPQSSRLPTEICDYILDHLWDDHKTLQVCSLVTREWLPGTRRHLFHSVRIINNLQRVAFQDVILRSGDAAALCIRKLDMRWHLNEGDRCFPNPPSVLQMLPSLGRLEELTLRNNVWDDCCSSAKTIKRPVLPMVKALHLHIGTVNNVVSLQGFICACPSLSSLKLWIGGISKCDSSHTHPPTVISGSMGIESFQCSAYERDPMLRWLLYCGLKLRMRRLAINVHDSPVPVNFLSLGDAQGLLHACGECLEHLIIRLSSQTSQISPGSLHGQQAALAHNPNLVSIYVSNVRCRSLGDWVFSSGWPSLLAILADIQPTHTRLQSIDITLVMTIEPDITSRPWEQFNAALARIMDISPQLIFTVWITCGFLKPAPWLAEFIGALLRRLVRVQAGRGRLCLMWLNGYDEVRELGHSMMPSWCSQW